VPLVTIGIPAYNRPGGLERAACAALEQDHQELEVLISDDASADPAVAEAASRLAADDSRVRFVRQPRNLGHAGNYQWLLEHAKGEHFMWLSDDDWIDPQYVSGCLAVLRADPATVLACGLARYYRDGAYVLDERPITLVSRHPGLRVIRYFARVSLNGPLFGVALRSALLEIGFPPVVGGDWLLVAALAARGRVRTLDNVHIHRELSGLGSDARWLARSFGMRGRAASHHHLVVAARIARDLSVGVPMFNRLRPVTRLAVGGAAAVLIAVRFTLADIVRGALGARVAGSIERRLSAWLRARDRP
jgi:glycosyltransferase involved in cell wall biosynthesis